MNTDMDTLELFVDRLGLWGITDLLAQIAYAKADHIASNWQDERTSDKWTKAGVRYGRLVCELEKLGFMREQRKLFA